MPSNESLLSLPKSEQLRSLQAARVKNQSSPPSYRRRLRLLRSWWLPESHLLDLLLKEGRPTPERHNWNHKNRWRARWIEQTDGTVAQSDLCYRGQATHLPGQH